MTDFANLVLKVDSNAVKTGSTELDKLTAAGARAEGAMEKLASEADTLRSRLDPMYAAQKRFDQELTIADRLLKTGTITTREYSAAQQLARETLQSHAAALHNTSSAAKQAQVGMQAVGVSAGRQRAGMQQLSFQLNDVATMYALGAKPAQIFASQIGQVTQAVSLMTNSTKGVIGFLGGPWGLVLSSATVLLAPFIARLWESGTAADDAANSVDNLTSAIERLNNVKSRPSLEDLGNVNIERLKAEARERNLTAEINRLEKAGPLTDVQGKGKIATTLVLKEKREELKGVQSELVNYQTTIKATEMRLEKYTALEQLAAQENEKSTKSTLGRSSAMSDVEKTYKRQVLESGRFIEGLEEEIARIGLDEKALRQLEVQRASESAATQAQRIRIAELNTERERAIALQAVEDARNDNASYQRDEIGPIERQMQVLGLLGAERDKAVSKLEEQAEVEALIVKIIAAETAGNVALAVELRNRVDLIRQKHAMERQGIDAADQIERETEAARVFNDQLRETIYLLNGLGKVGGVLGGLLGFVSGNIGSVSGPIGALLNMQVGTGEDEKTGKTFAITMGDELRDIFKLGGTFGKTMESLLGGAGTGMIAGQAFFGQQSKTEQLGSALGGALGKVAGDAIGKGIGGALGQAMGPLGSILGGVLGGVLGGMLSKTPWGRVTLSAQGASNPEGNSGASRRAAVKAGGSFDTALQDIASAFDGAVGDFGNIVLGVRHGDWRVNANGTSLKIKKGAVEFDEDAEGAIAYALQIAIDRGAITGIREATQRLLKSSDNLASNLEKALKFEGVFKELESLKNPLEFALGELTREFDKLKKIFDEAGASAAEYAQLEELLAIKRADIVADEGRRAVDKFSDRNSLEVELLRLMGREEDALAAARLNELAATTAALQPLQAMIYQLQDARAIIDQFAPLADDLRAFRKEITGSATGASGYAVKASEFRSTAALARDGDAGALGNLRSTASEFLDAAKANASSAVEYQRAVGEVLGAIDSGIFAVDSQIEYAQLQIDAVNNSANIIAGMREEMKVYQQQIVENTSHMARLWARFEGDGLPVRTFEGEPLEVI